MSFELFKKAAKEKEERVCSRRGLYSPFFVLRDAMLAWYVLFIALCLTLVRAGASHQSVCLVSSLKWLNRCS